MIQDEEKPKCPGCGDRRKTERVRLRYCDKCLRRAEEIAKRDYSHLINKYFK
jgi:tRNA(Ile2) C34 agmatinyltransferase TiaS